MDRYSIPSGKVFGSKQRRSDREVFDLLGVETAQAGDDVEAADPGERRLAQVADASELTPMERRVFFAYKHGKAVPQLTALLNLSPANLADVIHDLNGKLEAVDETDLLVPEP
jgi:hypothetical protein